MVEVSNPVCGDILRLTAVVSDGQVTAVAFKVRGCSASIACGSALTELMLARKLALICKNDIEAAVAGLSNESKHAAVLCMDAVTLLLSAER